MIAEAGSVPVGNVHPLDTARFASSGWRGIAILRRLLLTLVICGQTLAAVYFLSAILPYHGGNTLEIAILVVFGLLFMWISVGFWIGVYGFIVRRFGGDRWSLCRRYSDEALAAVRWRAPPS